MGPEDYQDGGSGFAEPVVPSLTWLLAVAAIVALVAWLSSPMSRSTVARLGRFAGFASQLAVLAFCVVFVFPWVWLAEAWREWSSRCPHGHAAEDCERCRKPQGG